MKIIPTDDKFPKLLRLDRSVSESYVLATYKSSEEEFITYRDNKAIAWATTEISALQLHEMYYQIYKERYR